MYIDSMGRIVASDELKHFGILGMHWGIRRFQPYPKGHTGDGKFVGENSKSGSSGTSNVSAGKQESSKKLESSKAGVTGVKAIDDVIAFAKKSAIPIKPDDWRNITGDARATAEIGLKAIDTVRGPGYIDDKLTDSDMDWFIFEDQTIGMYEIADLARQGKSKEEIKRIIEEASEVYRPYDELPFEDRASNRKLVDDNTAKGTVNALGRLDYFNWEELEYGDASGEQFIDECIKEAEKRKNLKHSYELTISNSGYLVVKDDYLAHHGILGQRWGRKNGPPYPLDASDHSASEKKAGWTKSLGSIAKATGKGVAKAARATGHGVKVAAKGTKKALIRVNLYPKKLMSAEDIAEKVERMRQEDTLKRAMGKLTNEDKLALKIKAKDARREIAKQTLTQLLPAIGKDLIIPSIKKSIDNKLEIKKKEEMNDLDNENSRDNKVWNDVYESALAAGKSIKEAAKIADQGGNKELGKKSNQDEKERDKKVWNDIYEDARANGKSASEAREIADSGKTDIPARKSDKNDKNGKSQFNLDSEIEKDIYNTAKKHGFTVTESAEMARNKDDSKLKGLFSNSSDGNKKNNGGNNQNPQQTSSTNSDLPKEVKNAIYNEWVKAGFTPKQAWAKAQAGDDYVGSFKTSYEEQAKKYDSDWAAAEKENKRRNTVAFNKLIGNAINAEASKHGVTITKSNKDRMQETVKKEHERTVKAIEESGGKVLETRDGKIFYEDSGKDKRSNNFVSRALERFEIEERKSKKG